MNDATREQPGAHEPRPGTERTYDVYFTTSAGRVYLRNPNRGVTISDDHLAWTFADKPDGAPFKNIVAVNLHSGGSWQKPIHICDVTFADRYKLIVIDADGLGFKSDEQSGIYRHFVYDLHGRLAAHAATRVGPPIVFTAGYPEGRYIFLLVLSVVMGLVFIGVPLAALLVSGELKPFMLLIVGALCIWPLAKMMRNNAPSKYDPARLPPELV